MIKVTVFGSGSSGNCYLLDNGTDQLMIETGLPLKKVAPQMDFNFSRLVGILISHEHGDHAKYIKQFVERTTAYVGASYGTFEAIDDNNWLPDEDRRYLKMKAKQSYDFGTFHVSAFDVQHDASEPFGFLITSKDDKLLYVTDTYYVKYRFNNVTKMLVEMNYSVNVLKEEIADGIQLAAILKNRLYRSHFEMKNALEFIKINRSSVLEDVILIHLSGSNSYPELFKQETQKITGVPVYLANEIAIS